MDWLTGKMTPRSRLPLPSTGFRLCKKQWKGGGGDRRGWLGSGGCQAGELDRERCERSKLKTTPSTPIGQHGGDTKQALASSVETAREILSLGQHPITPMPPCVGNATSDTWIRLSVCSSLSSLSSPSSPHA